MSGPVRHTSLDGDPLEKSLNVKEALTWGIAELSQSDSPQLDAELLLQEAIGLTTAQQISREDQILETAKQTTFHLLIAERAKGVPIAYLLGLREFYSLDFIVTPDVLIPRPDTELLVDLVFDKKLDQQAVAIRPYRILDLGTGSGAIAVSLAKNWPDADVYAVEQSSSALSVARQNACLHGVERIQFFEGSWFEPLPEKIVFDVIVCNPPYIDASDPHLGQGDVRFEPHSALVAENAGLADYQQIIARALPYLVPGGQILFEHGCDQAFDVQSLLAEAGFSELVTHRDLAGLDRVTIGIA